MQMPARTPTMAAMTAMTLAQLSGNRFIIGVGASGPQVIEGWHGVAYGRPVTRLKEYVQIMRRVFAREDALSFDGKEYQIPYKGPGSHRPRQAAQEHPALREADPDLRGDADAGRRAGRGRGGRRLLPGVDGPRPVQGVPGADREGLQGGGRRQDAGAVRRRARSWRSTSATTSRPAWHRCASTWRSTSAAWGPRTRTSTPTTRPGSASAMPRGRCRTSISPARRRRRPPSCPRRWSTPATWSVRPRASATGCSAGRRPARRATSAPC